MKYAGIGSRETPKDVEEKIGRYAKQLSKLGVLLRSGGANGADKAFANFVPKHMKEIYLPWRGFNAVDTLFDEPTEKAMDIAERFHPYWQNMKSGGKLLQARNSHIILGANCDDPVDFVICWTDNGKIKGGTGQGMRIAQHYNIPIYNLFNISDEAKLQEKIAEIENSAELVEDKKEKVRILE